MIIQYSDLSIRRSESKFSQPSFVRVFQIILIWFILLCLPWSAIFAQENKTEPLKRILFVFDASQSMWGQWEGKSKMEVARMLLIRVVDSLEKVPQTELALRVYGHQYAYPPGRCDDSKLEVPFGKNNHARIKAVLRNTTPKGTTPIAYSLGQAASDFNGLTDSRNMIILITDGLEECGGDPCAVSRELQKNGIVLKPFVIGLGTGMSNELDCIGTYFDAEDADNFATALKVALKQVSKDLTTLTVELENGRGVAKVTDIAMSFYDQENNELTYNFVHTMHEKGTPDTLYVDHNPLYRLELHTRPSLNLKDIQLLEKEHNTIAIPVTQGKIRLETTNKMPFGKEMYGLVKRCGNPSVLHVIQSSQTEEYLTGCYDLEILSLPRLLLENIIVEENQVRQITIPEPGVLVLQRRHPVIGDLFVEHQGTLVWIHSLDSESVTAESLVLLPGDYRVIFRAAKAQRAAYTRETQFRIVSGKTKKIKL